jgi:hypothetical protein
MTYKTFLKILLILSFCTNLLSSIVTYAYKNIDYTVACPSESSNCKTYFNNSNDSCVLPGDSFVSDCIIYNYSNNFGNKTTDNCSSFTDFFSPCKYEYGTSKTNTYTTPSTNSNSYCDYLSTKECVDIPVSQPEPFDNFGNKTTDNCSSFTDFFSPCKYEYGTSKTNTYTTPSTNSNSYCDYLSTKECVDIPVSQSKLSNDFDIPTFTDPVRNCELNNLNCVSNNNLDSYSDITSNSFQSFSLTNEWVPSEFFVNQNTPNQEFQFSNTENNNNFYSEYSNNSYENSGFYFDGYNG